MPVVELAGAQIEVDEDGFIQDPDLWTEALAAAIAETEEVYELTDDHWVVIN